MDAWERDECASFLPFAHELSADTAADVFRITLEYLTEGR